MMAGYIGAYYANVILSGPLSKAIDRGGVYEIFDVLSLSQSD